MAKNYQRRHVAMSPQERRQLEEAKARYEKERGPTDWGHFLAVSTGIGLAALGIYTLAKASKRNATTWQVECPNCHSSFPVVVRDNPEIAQIGCPQCEAELVVDFSTPTASGRTDSLDAQRGEAMMVYCHHCGQQSEVRFWGSAPERLRCPVCGDVAIYGMGQIQQDL